MEVFLSLDGGCDEVGDRGGRWERMKHTMVRGRGRISLVSPTLTFKVLTVAYDGCRGKD